MKNSKFNTFKKENNQKNKQDDCNKQKCKDGVSNVLNKLFGNIKENSDIKKVINDFKEANSNNNQVKGLLGKIGDMFNQELNKNSVKTKNDIV